MDIKMPVVDGFKATRRLKDSGTTANIPVIALTGSTIDYEATKEQSIWSSQLLKPVTMDALILCLKDFIPHEIVTSEQVTATPKPVGSCLGQYLQNDDLEPYRKVAEALAEFGQRARQLKDKLSIDVIEEFANEFRLFCQDNRLESITLLCDKLLEEIQMFEIEKIRTILQLIAQFEDYTY
jgi:CheY-like chemotaxis protein